MGVMTKEITGEKAVKFIIEKMWYHLPNATCMHCGNSYTGGVYKKINGKLMCEKCVICAMIVNNASDKELKSEKQKAIAEK
jgi:hypothetical protein